MDRMSPYRPAAGLTLVELLIALLIAAIALAVGVPSLGRQLQDNRLETESRRLLSALTLARSESVLRGVPVSVCPLGVDGEGAPACGPAYDNGWVVFANTDRDRDVDPADSVLRVFRAPPAGYRVTNRSGLVRAGELINYLPDGTAHRNLTLQFCPPEGGVVAPVSIVLNIVGRARLQRNWGACPALS